MQKGDLETAKKMIKEAGYNGQKAVIINPTDFATIGPLGDITYDMLKKIGINAELQATDWGSVVQRRATKEPVEKGGWSVFHTWFTGGFILNPVVTAPFRGQGAAGWFGWYDNPKIEAADPGVAGREGRGRAQEDRGGDPAGELRAGADGDAGPVPDPTAYRKSLAGSWSAPARCSGTSGGRDVTRSASPGSPRSARWCR